MSQELYFEANIHVGSTRVFCYMDLSWTTSGPANNGENGVSSFYRLFYPILIIAILAGNKDIHES